MGNSFFLGGVEARKVGIRNHGMGYYTTGARLSSVLVPTMVMILLCNVMERASID
jgi:hypothetical protein